MKVALVCPYSLSTAGGVQNQTLGMAGYLHREGHEVFVLAPGVAPADLLQSAGVPRAAIFGAGWAIPVPYNGSVARIRFGPVTGRRVAKWLRQVRPDLIHIHEPLSPSVGLLALQAAAAPVVATFHSSSPNSRLTGLAKHVLAPQLSKITQATAVSAAAAELVTRHLGLATTILPNGVDVQHFAAGRARAIPRVRQARAPRILFLGRVGEPRKGLDVLLKALPRIRALIPQAQVWVAGAGSPVPGANQQHFGEVSQQLRRALLGAAEVLVAPNLGRESFGLILVEALACGTSVVASDLPAFRAVVGAAAPAARMFATADPEALAVQVRAALASRVDDRELVRASAARVAAQYDWSRVGASLVALYQRTLTSSVPVPATVAPA